MDKQIHYRQFGKNVITTITNSSVNVYLGSNIIILISKLESFEEYLLLEVGLKHGFNSQTILSFLDQSGNIAISVKTKEKD